MPSDGRKCNTLQEAVWSLGSHCHLLMVCSGTTGTSTSDSRWESMLWKFPHLCFLWAKLKIQSTLNCCTWCWTSALSHCNHMRINPDLTQALCTCTSPTFQWKLPRRSLHHTLVLTEFTSIYGFHEGICNLRYCFVLVFSLKAQRILDGGFKILSERGLSD